MGAAGGSTSGAVDGMSTGGGSLSVVQPDSTAASARQVPVAEREKILWVMAMFPVFQ
jgi:hypothetical protein